MMLNSFLRKITRTLNKHKQAPQEALKAKVAMPESKSRNWIAQAYKFAVA